MTAARESAATTSVWYPLDRTERVLGSAASDSSPISPATESSEAEGLAIAFIGFDGLFATMSQRDWNAAAQD
jgi:hypothetical protein